MCTTANIGYHQHHKNVRTVGVFFLCSIGNFENEKVRNLGGNSPPPPSPSRIPFIGLANDRFRFEMHSLRYNADDANKNTNT